MGMGGTSDVRLLFFKLLYKWCCFRIFICTEIMIITDQIREIYVNVKITEESSNGVLSANADEDLLSPGCFCIEFGSLRR